MTSGPPPSAASSSKAANAASTTSTLQHQIFGSPLSSGSLNATLPQNYYREGAWNAPLPPRYYGYPPMNTTIGPVAYPAGPTMPPLSAGHIYGSGTKTNPPSSAGTNAPTPPRPPTPPPPDPETYKHWDEVIKKFLARTKMSQTLKGLESDMLVLNPDWEQETIPEALKEMVQGLQAILDRVSGKKVSEENDMDFGGANVDITNLVPNPLGVRPLEERKLDYIHLEHGVQPRSQSSINKSISQFLSRTRARNDASNRQEFLYTLAEKKRKLQAINGDTPIQMEISSCARVDSKPIDRDKQITYDIAKYGEGPLKKIPASTEIPPETISSTSAELPPQPLVEPTPGLSHSFNKVQGQRKRKLADLDQTGMDQNLRSSKTKSRGKGKGKAKEKAASVPLEQEEVDPEHVALSAATPERHPGLDERLKNLETHLALRYVPSPPRTLLARLKFLEDHVIKLEKEYPPWAALHFNQPNRGWPPPPRATPVIVPPQLRSNTSFTEPPSSSTNLDTLSTTQASSISSQPGSVLAGGKPRKVNSSLHKAVLDRLEVQRAISEMSGKG